MKVVILAGGYGTRLSEYTEQIPKPMVTVGGKPILLHIMNIYAQYGHRDFIIALGYKADMVKDYFLNYRSLNSDFTLNLKSGDIKYHNSVDDDWNISLVDTGLETMTGGRLRRLRQHLGNETFMLTYGDGLANVNLDLLQNFHENHGKMVTVSAVHPGARFGELDIDGDMVSSFKEKPQTNQGWINGGFFVIEPDFLDLIDNDYTVLEREPLETVAKNNELVAYRHSGYWQCMDTKRDRDSLEDLWETGSPPWTRT